MEYKEYFLKTRKEFLSSLEKIRETQSNILKDIIDSNSTCEYGKKHNFSNIKTIDDFQKNVPISTYENYIPYIEKIKIGKKNILTTQEVLLLEPTSGSSSSIKLAPYTKGLKDAFNNGIKPWLSDLFLNYPQTINQPMYWSITPTIKHSNLDSKVKIGFDNDMEYLEDVFKHIITKEIIIPPQISQNTDEFQQFSADFLASNKNLGLISIWNPYLLILFIKKLKEEPKDIWKNLKIISCWDEANSKMYAQKLKEYFPNTKIQGKGLLATEAIMTIPIENIGKVPCITSHFFEYIDTQTNEIKLLDELEIGKDYSILLTTQGGLYRYKIGDIVTVYDKYKNCPLLSFKGRENNISDYFGEKLSEDFINSILEKENLQNSAEFYLFAPNYTKNSFSYILYMEPKANIDFLKLKTSIEKELQKSFHYKYARQLGQIADFKICKIKEGMKQYIEICTKKGQRIGDIKPKTFTNCVDYEFIGEFIV